MFVLSSKTAVFYEIRKGEYRSTEVQKYSEKHENDFTSGLQVNGNIPGDEVQKTERQRGDKRGVEMKEVGGQEQRREKVGRSKKKCGTEECKVEERQKTAEERRKKQKNTSRGERK